MAGAPSVPTVDPDMNSPATVTTQLPKVGPRLGIKAFSLIAGVKVKKKGCELTACIVSTHIFIGCLPADAGERQITCVSVASTATV